MSKEIRLERIKDLKICVKKSPITMAVGLSFSVIGVLFSLFLPHFFWAPYLSLGVFMVVIPVAIKLNKLNKKHAIWLEDNENLITVLDSFSPAFVHVKGKAGFFCIAIDQFEPRHEKLSMAVDSMNRVRSASIIYATTTKIRKK